MGLVQLFGGMMASPMMFELTRTLEDKVVSGVSEKLNNQLMERTAPVISDLVTPTLKEVGTCCFFFERYGLTK